MTFAKEALPFVAPFVIGAICAGLLGRTGWVVTALLLGLGVLLFFRVPHRATRAADSAVLAPANGRITKIDRVRLPEWGDAEFQRIVTFLSVFNIHVQRSPVTAEVVGSHYTPGRKVAAFREDADLVNENQLLILQTESGQIFAVRQIAGLVARRVVSHVGVGDRLERGGLFGLIKFGSRVDLLLPVDHSVQVQVGDTLHEGLTVVAMGPSDPADTASAAVTPAP